jgi:hypothetical protein
VLTVLLCAFPAAPVPNYVGYIPVAGALVFATLIPVAMSTFTSAIVAPALLMRGGATCQPVQTKFLLFVGRC